MLAEQTEFRAAPDIWVYIKVGSVHKRRKEGGGEREVISLRLPSVLQSCQDIYHEKCNLLLPLQVYIELASSDRILLLQFYIIR